MTDANGEFLLTAEKPFEMMTVKVEARRLAPNFRETSGGASHDLTMTDGASLTGRVVSTEIR